MKNKFKEVTNQVNFIELEHRILKKWEAEDTFNRLREKNKGNKKWSFLDGPITANNPMGVHHAWGRSLKDIYQRFHAMNGKELRYQNGFDCQGLWVEVEVEKELGFKSKRDIEEYGIGKFVQLCKDRVKKYSSIQTEQSKRLGYWMDWENSYFTMSDENNYTIWSFLKKLFNEGKIYKGTDVVPWSGRSGTSYSQMEIIEGRKLVAHRSVFVRFPLKDKKNEFLLVWTTTPWTLTANISAAVNIDLDYVKLEANDGSIYYFADDNLNFKRLDKQFKDKKNWIDSVPKLKTISQIFKERGGFKVIDKIKGSEMLGWRYSGPFDSFKAQNELGGYPYVNDSLKDKGISAIDCHIVIDGGKDNIGNDVVVSGEGTGIVHIATGCGAIDNRIGKSNSLVEIAPLDDEAKFLSGFDWLEGKLATESNTIDEVIDYLKVNQFLVYVEEYPHVYPHCWRSGDELVYRSVEEWYINMDWRENIKKIVGDINWIPDWGHDREMEWLDNMGDWMISKKRFWGLALPIWAFEDGSFFVVGSKEELKSLAVEGYENFEGKSPHRPWIDKVKIKHPETGLIGKRILDVGNPWLDAGIVPYSTMHYNSDRDYWKKWFPADFVVECFPGQFRNWFYSLLAMSTMMENKAPFKTLLGHGLVKDQNGKEMHKSWGNAIWFEDAAEKMGVDVMRWLYASQNPEKNLLFGYNAADEVRKHLITLWNTYSFFVTYANLDNFNPQLDFVDDSKMMNKLDKWILARIYQFTSNAKKYYESFEVYKLMKDSENLIDDLSNWYIRRNRRRFWRSENDVDKKAAYSTLYTVILEYAKIMAPIVPFISEEIYQNLSCDSNSTKSVHLESFPSFKIDNSQKALINEIDSLINIVSLGRSARNKANIKIRQPLSEVIICCNQDLEKIAIDNEIEILEELNIKQLKLISDKEQLVSFNIKPNFQSLSQKAGKYMKEVVKFINSIENDKLLDCNNYKIAYKCNDFELRISYEDLIIEEVPIEGYSVSISKDFIIGINTLIDKELYFEGVTRDLIRHIQNLRKTSDLKVDDRIIIGIDCENEYLDAIEQNEEYFLNETLALKHSASIVNMEYVDKVKINGKNVSIGIKVWRGSNEKELD